MAMQLNGARQHDIPMQAGAQLRQAPFLPADGGAACTLQAAQLAKFLPVNFMSFLRDARKITQMNVATPEALSAKLRITHVP